MPSFPIDEHLALEALGDDESLYHEIIAVFLEDSPNQIRQFVEGQKKGDVSSAIIAVHSLKSSAGVVGAVYVQKLAANIEAFLRKGEIERGFSHIDELKDLLSVAREALSRIIQVEGEVSEIKAIIPAEKSTLNPLQILLVDDDATSRTNILGLLKTLGADKEKITICPTFSTALAALKEKSLDLLILDYYLEQDHTALEILNYVQTMGITAPVVILTGNDEEDHDLKLLQAGAADYLVKSELRPKSLERSLRYAIERSKRQAELVMIEQLERERTALRNSIKGLEKVLSVVGHELRTPAASIRLTLELMLMETEMERSVVEKNINTTLKEVIRLSNLVEDIIDVTKLNSGVTEWFWENVSLHAACEEGLRTLRADIEEKGLKLEINILPNDLTMKGDSVAITRVIKNLVSNSLKNTDSGTISIRIDELDILNERYISMTVSDTGCGISEEKLSKLGEAFTLSAGAVGGNYISGSGLGLAIVRPIVFAHGGKIEFSSILGEGTTAKITLKKELQSSTTATRT